MHLIQRKGEGEEAGKNHGGPDVWKGVRGSTMLHMILSLSVATLFAHYTN